MKSSREQIERLCLLECVACAAQLCHIARKRCRVARNVHDLRRLHFKNRVACSRVQTLARRIDHQHINTALGQPLRRLTGIRTEELCVFHAVAKRVALGVFDGLRHDFHANGSLCVLGQRQRDRTRTAVEVKHGLLAGQTGVVHRTRIQALGLRVIDLIKRLGREQKRVPAQAVLQHRLTPENIRPVTQNHVIVALVVVEQNTRQRRRCRAQTLD